MKAAVSSVTPDGPTITHYSLTKLGICVPSDWSTRQAVDFAESKLHCVNNFHWTTQIGTDDHTIQPCELQHGFKHLTLTIEPDSNNTTTLHPALTIHEPSIHARVIINIEDIPAENILKTAHSIKLLSEYLQLKAAAAEARTNNHHDEASRHEALADHLNSQLLAQFEGTIVFV
jgi:hypothetical protein